ncbi:HBS1-like protein isoform X1 [Phalaenopsis equestris]|uniref:HBS1-like protein isoform X1 n=1 Tax=Phalaenopsis equestris TaxID=78828 RepID=UPI0009E3D5C4|nr:HBS1-like protein isoform X1 [Phalaenopsis equestris]
MLLGTSPHVHATCPKEISKTAQKGKGSFAFAWAMDETSEERERGITMTVAIAYFESKKYRVVLLDSPGHKDFISNVISGASQADVAILVVDASTGSFEAGMGVYDVGQTKEHAQLIRSFGVEQIIVAVNKMDAVGYSQERFDYIKFQLASFLRSCGFKETLITWIPLSAMDNQNLVSLASNGQMSWYQGLCLLDAIDSLHPPERDVLKPILLPVCDVVSSHSLGQVAAFGKLAAGAIRQGSKVLVMPPGDLATVRSIERDSQACVSARAGDHVAVSLQGIDIANILPGAVLCHPDFPITVASILELRILVLDVKMPILIGSHVEFHVHHAKEAAQVTKIASLMDQKKGKTSQRAPRLLTARQSATIEVSLDRPVCVEEFSSCRMLGRACLRASGITIAVGIVTRIIAEDEQ